MPDHANVSRLRHWRAFLLALLIPAFLADVAEAGDAEEVTLTGSAWSAPVEFTIDWDDGDAPEFGAFYPLASGLRVGAICDVEPFSGDFAAQIHLKLAF